MVALTWASRGKVVHSLMSILIAVPVFNEEKYVGRVLSEIRREAGKCTDVLLADDAVRTDSVACFWAIGLRVRYGLLIHPENRGASASR